MRCHWLLCCCTLAALEPITVLSASTVAADAVLRIRHSELLCFQMAPFCYSFCQRLLQTISQPTVQKFLRCPILYKWYAHLQFRSFALHLFYPSLSLKSKLSPQRHGVLSVAPLSPSPRLLPPLYGIHILPITNGRVRDRAPSRTVKFY